MITVIEANIVPILIAVAIGIIAGWWMFRHRRSGQSKLRPERSPELGAAPDAPPPPPLRPYMRSRPIRDGIDTVEGRGVADEGAAAVTDLAGEVLGIRAHHELSGGGAAADDLQMLKGVGPKLAQKLNEQGIMSFGQLAGLNPTEVALLDSKLGPFKGRLERDRIVEQANYLARGDRDGFEARFGKLGGNG